MRIESADILAIKIVAAGVVLYGAALILTGIQIAISTAARVWLVLKNSTRGSDGNHQRIDAKADSDLF